MPSVNSVVRFRSSGFKMSAIAYVGVCGFLVCGGAFWSVCVIRGVELKAFRIEAYDFGLEVSSVNKWFCM